MYLHACRRVKITMFTVASDAYAYLPVPELINVHIYICIYSMHATYKCIYMYIPVHKEGCSWYSTGRVAHTSVQYVHTCTMYMYH